IVEQHEEREVRAEDRLVDPLFAVRPASGAPHVRQVGMEDEGVGVGHAFQPTRRSIAAVSERSFEIDPDIRRAATLPARVYSDPALFRLQQERIFARTWQYAGHDDLVSVAGQVFPFTLLPGALDEPLVLTRDADDRLHCLSNVCTHRGTLVVDGAGHLAQLRCRYHGRRFALDGRFHSMPEFEGTAGFPSSKDDLPEVALGSWERFLLVALAPAMPIVDVMAPLAARLQHLPFSSLSFDPAGARDYVVSANWALYIDNY